MQKKEKKKADLLFNPNNRIYFRHKNFPKINQKFDKFKF